LTIFYVYASNAIIVIIIIIDKFWTHIISRVAIYLLNILLYVTTFWTTLSAFPIAGLTIWSICQAMWLQHRLCPVTIPSGSATGKWKPMFTISFPNVMDSARTHARTQPFYGPLGFCPGLPGWADTRKVPPGR